jgi:alkylhydroperoxidase family enzyme
MTRISELPLDQWDPELRALSRADSAPEMVLQRMSITAHAPHMAKAVIAFKTEAAKGRLLAPRLIELVRLRVAFHNQCRTCMAVRYQSAYDDGLTDDLVCSLEKPVDAPGLTEGEKAALAYVDMFATNHLAIDDAMFDRLRGHFSEAEIVELCLTVSHFIAFGRFVAVMGQVEGLPEGFHDKSIATAPWEVGESILLAG